MTRAEAVAYRMKIQKAAESQTDEDALQSIELFAPWKPNIDVVVGSRYQYNHKLYRCLQNHRTQSDWTPDVTPALWTEVSIEEWPEWRQPLGSEDSYMTNDKVTHSGQHWVSTLDYNVYEPGVYGWDLVN